MLAGNTSDKTTLGDFLQSIEAQYGQAQRTWVMDRGIPTEEILQAMRDSSRPIFYLVGTPKGKLSKLEQAFLDKPWKQVRDEVQVRLLPQDRELYILARSTRRMHKERAMRQRRLKKLWSRLKELQTQKITRDTLLLKLGAAKKEAGRVYALVDICLPKPGQTVNPETFTFRLRKEKLREVRKREGCYLLRSNLVEQDPAQLWQYYMQLTEVEQAFKELKGDLAIRPIYHQLDTRIEAHIFVAFLAYCLQVTLKFQAHRKPQAYPSGHPGKIRRTTNAGCASSHHRWAPTHSLPLYPAGPGSKTIVAPTEVDPAQTTAPVPGGQGGRPYLISSRL